MSIVEVQRATVTATGATFEDAIGFDEWAAVGRRLSGHESALRWAIGDWMVYGAEHFGAKAIVLAAATGLAEKTIANTVSVCRAIAPERRRPELSFTHHEEASRLSAEEQDRVLGIAAENRLSAYEVRALVSDAVKGKKDLPVNRNRHALSLAIEGEVSIGMMRDAAASAASACQAWFDDADLAVTVTVQRAD